MLGAVLKEINKPLELIDLEIPELQKGQVLVKIKYAGFCGSQLNEITGRKGEDKFLPHLLGHEASGEVVSIGEGITKVKIGDSVLCTWEKMEGLEGGGKRYGNINAGPITTFQELSIISENRLVKNIYNIPDHILPLFGCMIPTAFGTIRNILKFTEGSSIIIFGAAGNIGTMAIVASKLSGAKKIIAVDKNMEKLKYSIKFGCDSIIPLDSLNSEDICICSNSDFSLEATGDVRCMELAYESVKKDGNVALVGNIETGRKILINPFDLNYGKTLLGSWGGKVKEKDIINYMKEYTEKKINLNEVKLNIYRLEDINKAISDVKKDIQGKVLIKIS